MQNSVVPAKYKHDENTGSGAQGGQSKPDALWKVYKFEATPEPIFEDVFISSAFEHLLIADAGGKIEFELTHGTSAERRADRSWLAQRGEGDSGRGRSITRIGIAVGLEAVSGVLDAFNRARQPLA